MSRPLSRIVSWSQQLLAEVLSPGDLAVDLTAGNGYDTLMLGRSVGPAGRVLAFDLQPEALQNSSARLQADGLEVRRLKAPSAASPPGVSLILASHADLADWCNEAPRAIIANLGYLPGGDRSLITRPESTLAALQAGCRLLAAGGRMAIVVYSGHPGGRDEAEVVEGFFAGLNESEFEVLRLEVANRPQAPFLLVAGKLASKD